MSTEDSGSRQFPVIPYNILVKSETEKPASPAHPQVGHIHGSFLEIFNKTKTISSGVTEDFKKGREKRVNSFSGKTFLT